MSNAIGPGEQKPEINEIKKATSSESDNPLSIQKKGKVYADALTPAQSAVELSVPKPGRSIMPTLAKPKDKVAQKPLPELLTSLNKTLKLDQRASLQQSTTPSQTPSSQGTAPPSPGGLQSYVDVMSKINAFEQKERRAVGSVNQSLNVLELNTILCWSDQGERVANLQNKVHSGDNSSETKQQLEGAQKTLANSLGLQGATYTPDFIESVAKTLAQTKKAIAIILDALDGTKGSNALVEFTAHKNEIAVAQTNVQKSLGNLDIEGGAFGLAQANLMQQAGSTIEAVTEDMNNLQADITTTNKQIRALSYTITGLTLAGIAAGFVPGAGPAIATGIGVVIATLAAALGVLQMHVGADMTKLGHDQQAIAADKRQFQNAKIESQTAQKFTEFMTDTIGSTYSDVKQMAEAFQQAMLAAEAAIHEIRN